jgi:glycosyltransferase involved in cell wall biosynthesis
VDINEYVNADIRYYINYFLYNEKPLNGVTVVNFTHYDPDLYFDKFIQAAKETEHCISISDETTKIMKGLGIEENKISTVIIGADKSFKPKLSLGIVALIKKNSDRKGEKLVKEITADKELVEDVQIVSLNDCWDLPIWNMDHTDFYRSIDYLLVPSLIEGGPVPFMEALACGTLAITPPIGVIPEFPHIEYETGI